MKMQNDYSNCNRQVVAGFVEASGRDMRLQQKATAYEIELSQSVVVAEEMDKANYRFFTLSTDAIGMLQCAQAGCPH
ncbi:MAG: hypothetical protein HY232_10245 [Acidobacteria bacterium]|nr:hypothetical protein [Acidobacteriota bacterium]